MSYQAEQHIYDTTSHAAGSTPAHTGAEQWAWVLAYAAAKSMGTFDARRPAAFRLDGGGHLYRVRSNESKAELLWSPPVGWMSVGTLDAAAHALLDLYLPISSASAEQPITVAHLGQSLDGFIATPSGDSSFVTGPENILHLHRLRALCDAVVVGAGTVSADNPQLTTRLVAGSSPVRVILDPACRLPLSLSVFNDRQAETVRVCAAGKASAHQILAPSESLLELAVGPAGLDLTELLRQLRARGYRRVLIEGGGVTVSSFLQAGLLDRLHIAVAPVLIGDGRAAVRLPPRLRLQDCLRLRHRIYRSGEDILFDCDLRAPADAGAGKSAAPRSLQRIL
ncbi:MAG: RibD family protein [Steroidobacteraceae bacterium]